MAQFENHQFYCIHCGNQGIPLPRKTGKLKEKEHLKNLYCIYCKEITRHIEIKNDYEINEFKEKFRNGGYKDAAENDILNGRVSGLGKINLYNQKNASV